MVENDAIRTTLAELTDGQRQKAMERFTVLRPVLEEALPLSTAAAHAKIPIRTAQRWLARHQAM